MMKREGGKAKEENQWMEDGARARKRRRKANFLFPRFPHKKGANK